MAMHFILEGKFNKISYATDALAKGVSFIFQVSVNHVVVKTIICPSILFEI